MRDLLRPLRLPGGLLLDKQVVGSVRCCSPKKYIFNGNHRVSDWRGIESATRDTVGRIAKEGRRPSMIVFVF